MKKLNTFAFIACMFLVLIGKSGLIEVIAAPNADSITITLYCDVRDTTDLQSYDPAVMYVTGHWSPPTEPGKGDWTFIQMDSIAPNIFKVTFKYGVGFFAGNVADDPDLLPDHPGWYFAPTNDWSTAENVPAPCNVAWDVQRIFVIDVTKPDTVVAFKYGKCDPVPLSSLGIPGLTGLDAVKKQNLVVYPNPSNGIIYVNLTSFTSNALIEVFDISGKVVRKVENATERATIDITEMPSSIYLVRISDGVSAVCKKIILR
jgi:hypothetical protein